MSIRSFNINRRNFLKSSGALLALSTYGAYGLDLVNPSAKPRVGLIGSGWYGKSDLLRLSQVLDIDVVALCDVDQQMLKGAQDLIQQRLGMKKPPRGYADYRKMLSESELDIVLIGSPDHWHALQGIEAMRSGADVYLQKPISIDVAEGRALTQAAKQYNSTVQVGLQRRSTHHLVEAKEQIIDKGLLGKISHVDMCCYYHMRADDNPALSPVPDYFDYDMWVGPAPMRPFDKMPHRGWWRAFREYSNGIMGDMCVHMFDATRWMLDLGWPNKVSSSGGIYVQTESKANTPDTQSATFVYDDLICTWQHRSWGNPADPEYPWAYKIYGEKGVLKCCVHKYEFVPEVEKQPSKTGKALYQREEYPEDVTEAGIELHVAAATRRHMLDFLKARAEGTKPVSDIETAHISTASCIMANLSMDIGRTIAYDPDKHEVVGDAEATKLLKRAYREGWEHPYA